MFSIRTHCEHQLFSYVYIIFANILKHSKTNLNIIWFYIVMYIMHVLYLKPENSTDCFCYICYLSLHRSTTYYYEHFTRTVLGIHWRCMFLVKNVFDCVYFLTAAGYLFFKFCLTEHYVSAVLVKWIAVFWMCSVFECMCSKMWYFSCAIFEMVIKSIF